eukprot:Lithocolla_globosa_v1_NODE_122_length_6074_cov_8.352550.p3 type:complete len:275 gc:universal NODE_122_length_6074_cov_8.352550:3571-2747(-)
MPYTSGSEGEIDPSRFSFDAKETTPLSKTFELGTLSNSIAESDANKNNLQLSQEQLVEQNMSRFNEMTNRLTPPTTSPPMEANTSQDGGLRSFKSMQNIQNELDLEKEGLGPVPKRKGRARGYTLSDMERVITQRRGPMDDMTRTRSREGLNLGVAAELSHSHSVHSHLPNNEIHHGNNNKVEPQEVTTINMQETKSDNNIPQEIELAKPLSQGKANEVAHLPSNMLPSSNSMQKSESMNLESFRIWSVQFFWTLRSSPLLCWSLLSIFYSSMT